MAAMTQAEIAEALGISHQMCPAAARAGTKI
jgi:DNA-binding XRE family transcriptional regulator